MTKHLQKPQNQPHSTIYHVISQDVLQATRQRKWNITKPRGCLFYKSRYDKPDYV